MLHEQLKILFYNQTVLEKLDYGYWHTELASDGWKFQMLKKKKLVSKVTGLQLISVEKYVIQFM